MWAFVAQFDQLLSFVALTAAWRDTSHTFTDLVLTVDAFEDKLLGAIDGNKTLGEILQIASHERDLERRALRFFKRLWAYDQIVFDASRSATQSAG